MRRLPGKAQLHKIVALAIGLLFITTSGWAAKDYYHYDKQGTNDKTTYNAETIAASTWSVAMCYLPATTSTTLRGRLIAANGTKVFLQDAVDSGSWTQVGEVDAANIMDASFIKVSPDGTKVALGMGYGKDLLVFPTSLLTGSTVSDLDGHTDTTTFSTNIVKYYDAAWVDNNHLVINGGNWDETTKTASSVGISCLDITDDMNTPVNIINSCPGASSGIAVDGSKNLIFGNGYTYNSAVSATGELKMLPVSDWWATSAPKTSGMPVAYSTGRTFADRVLSAAHLGFDQEGNLHVGGGQYWNAPNPNTENGYAVLINKKIITDTAASSTAGVIDESDATQYREIAADSCRNDTATGVFSYGRSITLNWIDGTGACTTGGCTDSWGPAVTSKLTTYRINTTRDGDSDGYTDVNDHSPWTGHSHDNLDSDNDGYGNIIDADLNNDGAVTGDDQDLMRAALGNTGNNLAADLNGDGVVNGDDQDIQRNLLGCTKPFYDTTF
ncbi:MAG: hypothetical protein GY737_07510 [Desulfobacteraceae bacterium]|nr:hypothetical protein [Desulfobacteraceae bacterium]